MTVRPEAVKPARPDSTTSPVAALVTATRSGRVAPIRTDTVSPVASVIWEAIVRFQISS